MRDSLLASGVGLASGMAAAIGVNDFESLTYFFSNMASVFVITGAIYAYIKREWQLKLAVTPLFLSGVIYLIYSYILPPADIADFGCQLLDAIGIITLMIYIVWNRRKTNDCKREKKETTTKEEKDTEAQLRVLM